MNKYPIAIYCDHPKVHFDHRTAARLARVSEEFIRRCEREELVTSRIMLYGKKGYVLCGCLQTQTGSPPPRGYGA